MKISRRDATALSVGAAAVFGLGFWTLVYRPVQEHLALLERRVQAKQSEYREVRDLAQRLTRLSSSAGQLEERLRRGRGFALQTYLEKVADELDLRRRITQMRGKGGETTRHFRESAVEIRMERIALSELVRYLYLVEHPKGEEADTALLRVRQLRIRPVPENRNLLDATFQVSGYELASKT